MGPNEMAIWAFRHNPLPGRFIQALPDISAAPCSLELERLPGCEALEIAPKLCLVRVQAPNNPRAPAPKTRRAQDASGCNTAMYICNVRSKDRPSI